MQAKRLGEVLQHPDARGFGVGDPVHEQSLSRLLVVLFPDLIEFRLEVVGRGQRRIQSESFRKTLRFLAGRIEVLLSLEQQPAHPFEHVFLHRVREFAIHGSPKFRELVVVELDHMKAIEHQPGAADGS